MRWLQQEFGAETFGIDLNPVAGSDVENFVLADGGRLPIEDGVFDVVFSMGLVEHFATFQLRRRLVSESVRVTKPRTGLIWLEHPNMNFSLDWLYIKYWYDYRQGYRHYRITDRETRRHLLSLGVEILQTRWLGWLPPTLVQSLADKLPRYLRGALRIVEKALRRKLFEHSLTADSFFVIGRRI